MSVTIEFIKPEEWRPVVGYEGLYEVSDHGQVRSLTRVYERVTRWGSIGTATSVGRILSQKRSIYGYCLVNLCVTGKQTICFTHRLVLEAFVGLPKPGEQAAHWDGNKLNNLKENLRWASPVENNADKFRHGTAAKKINRCIAYKIKTHLKSTNGRTRKVIAEQCGVSVYTVADIARGRTWRWV